MQKRMFGTGGQRRERLAGRYEFLAQRQFAAQHVNLFEIIIEHGFRLLADRVFQSLRGDERVAVAVAPDPGARLEERQNRRRSGHKGAPGGV